MTKELAILRVIIKDLAMIRHIEYKCRALSILLDNLFNHKICKVDAIDIASYGLSLI